MKRLKSLLLLLAMAVGVFAIDYPYDTVPGDLLHARIYKLPNGLTVCLSQNPETPKIQTFIAVRAGSFNDPLESTGLAHYLEHVMFKGTTHYGTTNYILEKPLLDAIDSLYEVYGRTTDPETRKAVYHLIDSVSYEGSKIAIANEFDKLMAGIGASGVNAFTSTEMTCYHEVIPAGELERWAAIESDRFQNLVIRGFHTELEAVYEEFNLYSTQDQDKVLQAVNSLLYPEIPYRQHSTIGTQEHLKNPSLLNVKRFWNYYYRPNNVAVCLSGDFAYDDAISVVARYFGGWQPNSDIPAETVKSAFVPTPSQRDTIVLGVESPMLWLAWRFPSANSADAEIAEVIAEILQNGKCGIFDLDIEQQQRMLGAYVFPDEGVDYTTFYVLGVPKDGQKLQAVRSILLEEIEKLKKGDFSEELIAAIIANKRRAEMEDMQDNEERAMTMVEAFINRIPWSQQVGRLERQAHITKQDIMRVANCYFTDHFACVYKHQGEDKNITQVAKPAISPIEMNRLAVSVFCDSLLCMNSTPLTPQFVDLQHDLLVDSLASRQLLYRCNTDDQLFTLRFIVNVDSKKEPMLQLMESYMPYLGTSTMTPEQLYTRLYHLACDISMSVYDEYICFEVSGLQENMPAALNLLNEWVKDVKADKQIFKVLVADEIDQHNYAKLDQGECFSALTYYATYGAEALQERTLTPKQMKKLNPSQCLKRLSDLAATCGRLVYYGPASLNEVKLLVNGSHFLSGDANPVEAQREKRRRVDSPEVFVAPFLAQNLYYCAIADWGEVYTPKDEAIIRLFNEYFCGSMGSVVFQEMRESRALAYSAYARYNAASHQGDENGFMTQIISQTDKLQDCVQAFDSICNFMPASESAFLQAKAALLKQIEQRRYVRMQPIEAYIQFEKKGWEYDYFMDIYEEVKRLTLDDVVAFQKSRVANRQYRYMILGNTNEMDMEFLQTLGPVRQLSIDDIFVY